jgi:acyl-CoA synthetase (AMP-forming)/AMP-acid ligase II
MGMTERKFMPVFLFYFISSISVLFAKYEQLLTCTGMTETCTTVALTPVSQKQGTFGSAGHLVPGSVAKVVKSDGSLAKFGEPGELVVKGPGNALGYANNAEA